MSRQAKIGLTLGFLILLGGIFALDAVTMERTLTGDLLGWQDLPEENIAPLGHLMDIIHQNGFSTLASPDEGFLSDVLPDDLPRERVIVLKDGDRAAFLEWMETDAAERYFLILKTVLYGSFSDRVEGVQDEEWNASVHVLTFRDPELSEEWFVFVRAYDQLMELRVPSHQLDPIRALLGAIFDSFE